MRLQQSAPILGNFGHNPDTLSTVSASIPPPFPPYVRVVRCVLRCMRPIVAIEPGVSSLEGSNPKRIFVDGRKHLQTGGLRPLGRGIQGKGVSLLSAMPILGACGAASAAHRNLSPLRIMNRCSSALDLPSGCTVILTDGKRVAHVHEHGTWKGEPLFEGQWSSETQGPRTLQFFSGEVTEVLEPED